LEVSSYRVFFCFAFFFVSSTVGLELDGILSLLRVLIIGKELSKDGGVLHLRPCEGCIINYLVFEIFWLSLSSCCCC
jgi:hypothetical protein